MTERWLGGLPGQIALLLVAAAVGFAAGAQNTQQGETTQPAQLSLFVFEQGAPVADLPLLVDGAQLNQTNAYGSVFFSLQPGDHTLRVTRPDGSTIADIPFEARSAEVAQIIIDLEPGATPRIAIESSVDKGAPVEEQQVAEGPAGTISGSVRSAEDGAPVQGAKIFVSGTALELVTGPQGEFSAEVPPGSYSVSVLEAEFATQTLDNISVASNQTTNLDVELTPAGLQLPEFVVLEPYVEGSLASVIEEQRDTANVANVLGAEAISRAGDSDAAAALKRVTGLTLIGGEFIVIRGLSERYSATLLNGANVPSPDPTRSVVPLNLFPADILATLVVQKSYSADMPGDFGGGSVNLRTVGIPQSSFIRFSTSLGAHDQTTSEDGLDYIGSDTDWRTVDGGIRQFPTDDFSTPEGTDVALTDIYTPFQEEQRYDYGAGVSGGYVQSIGDNWTLGFIAALNYSDKYRNRFEERSSFTARTTPEGEVILSELDNFDLSITRRNTEISAYVAGGVEYGEDHALDLRYIRLLASEDEVDFREGSDAEDQTLRLTELEFESEDFEAYQASGSHRIPQALGIEVDWTYSTATTFREAPDQRQSRYGFNESSGEFVFSLRRGGAGIERAWSELNDQIDNWFVDVKIPFEFADGDYKVNILGGYNDTQGERDSFIRRYTFECPNSSECFALDLTAPLEEILRDENLASEGGPFVLTESTLRTDTYTGTLDVVGTYAGLDVTLFDKFRLAGGYRYEDFLQQTITVNRFDPENAEAISAIDTDDYLPALTATYFIDDSSQFRASWSRTVTRPEFREVSASPFVEPRLDFIVTGNPDLLPAELTNWDARYEYYFNTLDNISVAAFYKTIRNPIELVFLGGAARRTSYTNGESARVRGFEIEAYKNLGGLADFWIFPDWMEDFYISGNYSWIDSQVSLGDNQGQLTNAIRPLQGQSPYVINAQVGYDNEDAGVQATLLFNRFGERISFVGVQGQPDIKEVPFNQLDFVISKEFFDGFQAKLKLDNLLDDEVRFRQGEETFRAFLPGRSFSLGISYKFD